MTCKFNPSKVKSHAQTLHRVNVGISPARLLLVVCLVVAWSVGASAQLAGYRDFSYGTSGTKSPTGEKPESKIWFNAGSWWGSLYNSTARTYHIYEFKTSSQSWVDTGTQLDNRSNTNADTLWDAGTGKLYVASHVFTTSGSATTTSSQWGRVYRYSYNSSTRTYSLDSGFPVNVNNAITETLVIAKDSKGVLWVTYTQNSRVYVNNTTGSDTQWNTPFRLPLANSNDGNLSSDDISSVIAFGPGKIGVMWSNQNDKKFHFSVHVDGNAATSWAAEETALPGPNGVGNGDDHINLKCITSDSTGRVFAAIKTSLTSSSAPLVMLLVRSSSGGWSNYTFGRVSDHHTRAIVMLDESSKRLYMFAASPDSGTPKSIYYKVTNMNSISFAQGLGAPLIQSTTDTNINNPSSTKQNVSSSTGLLVIASDSTSHRYLHNYLTLGSLTVPAISSFSPTSGAVGKQVVITGTNLGGVSRIAFNGRVATISSATSTQIVTTVPSGATTGPITASTVQGPVATSSGRFTVN